MGGETAINLLDVLDWEALAAVEPTWVIGFSDTTTSMLPLTLRLDWATVHGAMLMDEPTASPTAGPVERPRVRDRSGRAARHPGPPHRGVRGLGR